jgi:hypothetical protein
MNGTISKCIEIAGVEDVEVEADFDASYVDNGIGSYEFWGARGVHHDYGWEVDSVEGLRLVSDLREVCENEVEARGWHKWNPVFWLLVWWLMWRIPRELAKLDPDDVFDNEELEEAAAEQGDTEPDYNED